MAKDRAAAREPQSEDTPESPTRSQRLLARLHAELADWSTAELQELQHDLGDLIAARRAEPVDDFKLTPSLRFWLRQVAQHEQVYQAGPQSAAASYYWQLQQLGYVDARPSDTTGTATRFCITERGRAALAGKPVT